MILSWPGPPRNRLAQAWWYPPAGVDKHEWFAAMREVEECSPDFGDEVPPGGRRTPEIERLARALDAYQQNYVPVEPPGPPMRIHLRPDSTPTERSVAILNVLRANGNVVLGSDDIKAVVEDAYARLNEENARVGLRPLPGYRPSEPTNRRS